jgi:hypothetical protein
MYALVAPFTLVGVIIILFTRLGWPCILILIIVIIILPLQGIVSKKNGAILQRVNVFKDKRVKTCK